LINSIFNNIEIENVSFPNSGLISFGESLEKNEPEKKILIASKDTSVRARLFKIFYSYELIFMESFSIDELHFQTAMNPDIAALLVEKGLLRKGGPLAIQTLSLLNGLKVPLISFKKIDLNDSKAFQNQVLDVFMSRY